MHTTLRCCALAIALGTAATAHAQVSAFDWRPARAPAVGTVWHYTKSNRDGSEPWHLDVYFAAPQRIEVVKWKPESIDFVEVHADLDPARAMPVVLSQWNTQGGKRSPTLSARADGDRALDVQLPDGHQAHIEAEHAPLHVWGFDLMGLAMMLPHLKQPDRAFSVDFIDPNRPGTDGAPFAVGAATFTPAGKETIDGGAARKYTLAGPIFGERTGTVWIDAASGRLERVEHGLRTSTDWSDFRLELESAEVLDGLAWERFKQGLADAQDGAGAAGPKLAAALQAGYDEDGLHGASAAEDAFRAKIEAGYEAENNTFGYALLGLGQTEDAIQVFQRGVHDWPQSVNAWDSLAEAQLEAGDRKSALASWRKVLELAPEHPRAKEQVEVLETKD